MSLTSTVSAFASVRSVWYYYTSSWTWVTHYWSGCLFSTKVIKYFQLQLFGTQNCTGARIIWQKMTPWAHLKGPAQVWPFQFKGKQCFTGLLASLQQNLCCTPRRWSEGCSSVSGHLMAPFNREISPSFAPQPPPPLPLCHYRHHCPQNGWQLLEIPGCVTTPRCTCCAIYIPPVLMPQQPERQRNIMPVPAKVAN